MLGGYSMNGKIHFTKLQKLLEALTLVILLGSIIYLITSWSSIPDTLPSHYNANGVVDDWSGKGSLITMPIISVILYAGLTILIFIPNIWNVPVEITEKNRTFIYENIITMLIIMKLIIISNFTYITICSAIESSLNNFFLPLVLIATFGTLATFITRIVIGNKNFK
jgi:uncharacterized membrane protein